MSPSTHRCPNRRDAMLPVTTMLFLSFSFLLLPAAVFAAPALVAEPTKDTASLGIYFENGSLDLPLLKLPYATYRAKSYNKDKDYYKFSNIRFAAPPVGQLRWEKPQPPQVLRDSDVQDGSVGWACHQDETNNLLSWYFDNNQPTSEDCLFLDVYVPGPAARGEVKNLPVLNWIYAGGYIFGSKDWFLYNTGLWPEKADNNLIYVSGNHRLGAFGWLTGPTVQKEATANVGFYDQRTVLQWIQDYIHLLGGDKNAVTAWGLSSGGSSVMHHLIARRGTSDPLFQRAIVNSPAFVPTYDKASMETAFQQFASKVGCSGSEGTIACLRQVPEAELQKASANTSESAPSGHFGFGPAIDDDYILDLPSDEFRRGHFWPNVTLLFSHLTHEGDGFTNTSIKTSAEFQNLLTASFPNMTAAARRELLALYPARANETETDRIANLIAKYAVTCNARWMARAYASSSSSAAAAAWGYRLSTPPAHHGQDTFYNWLRPELGAIDGHVVGGLLDGVSGAATGAVSEALGLGLGVSWDDAGQRAVAQRVQGFIASFARSGDPNKFGGDEHEQAMGLGALLGGGGGGGTSKGDDGLVAIPGAEVGDKVRMLDVGPGGEAVVVEDEQMPADECEWWAAGRWTGRAEDGV